MPTDLEKTIQALQDTLNKAVTNSTYTFSPATRSIFAPENLDPVVKLVVPTDAPLRNRLPRVQGFGQAAAWKRMTSQLHPRLPNTGGAAGTGTSGFFADAGTPGSTTQTFTVVTAAYKNIGRDVEIGRQALASSRGYQDIRDELVKIKVLEVMLAEEDGIINGDSNFDANSFDGLIKQLTTNSGTMSLLTASGVGNQIQTPMWQYGSRPELLVANPRQIKALADDLQGSGSIQRIVVGNQGEGIGGVHMAKIVNPIDGSLIDVIAHRLMGTWALLLDIKGDAGQNWIEMEDLESMRVYEPPVSTHSVLSRVYETTVLKVINETAQIKIGGLATS